MELKSENLQKCFFHVDLDAFFASVEQLVHPEYRGKPVIISGDPHHKRNVVSTASYEARKYGVHSAMPSFKAYELCPDGIFVEPHMDLYYEYSKKVMNILKDYSPDVFQLSIDEACLDMTGTTRLFGKPEETAKKLKERVKEETGLTISVGIATNSYLAKICSDIKKPDGLYEILPGQEEKFMEQLPLAKVWGVGQKTLARLNSCGLRKIQDIKSHSREFLKSIIGDAGSSFLYNVCRGIEPENFRAKPKSHSLSTESTYEFDLTDRNVIEVSILDLCCQVMERLLYSNLTSLTVQLKIRYEDFTTVNIQQTYETPVLCTDDLYSRIISLFDKKYEFGRGIRLLGVGVQNTIKVNQIIQPELFESSNKKKQQIEKAILELEVKNPEIKISKARLLTKTRILICAFILSLCSISKTQAQNINTDSSPRPSQSVSKPEGAATITDPALLPPPGFAERTTLYNYQIDDKNIELEAQGFWNINLLQTTTATFGYDHDFTVSFGIPVFEQEIDLSLWFLLNNHFYIQGAFADKFEKNTFALGYYSDDVIKEVKISNRNIVFPDIYSVSQLSRSIGGGDNQAPGISATFSDDKWRVDAAVRYDMLTTFDKTYYGKNAVNLLKLSKENYVTGILYVLPDSDSVRDLIAIYVESNTGTFVDEAGRRYKKLAHSDYLLVPAKSQIILSPDAGASKKNGITPCVLFEFSSPADTVLASKLGTFGTADSPGTEYLGEIQKYFGKELTGTRPDVTLYSYSGKKNHISVPDPAGNTAAGFFVELNGKNLLLAQNSSGFSPFAALYRYDGGTSSVQDVQVASYTSETPSTYYSALVSDDINLTKTDFFSSKRTFVDVYSPGVHISDFSDYTKPEVNFPFAGRSPGTYLGYASTNDDCIMLKSFTQTTRIEIGTKAIPGTVTVYKNGIIDASAKYNPQTGEIKLGSGVKDSDKLYITWCEESSSYETGMISGAVGFKYDFSEKLTADAALTTGWSLSPDLTYAENNRTAKGYTTLAGGVKITEEKLKFSNTAGLTLAVDNVTGNYRIFGMDNSVPSTAYLSQDAARSLPQGFSPYLNPRPYSGEGIVELETHNNCSVQTTTGYTDPKISGYSIPVHYNFNRTPSSQTQWAATTIITNANKSILSNASKIELALKLSDEFINLTKETDVETKVYVQLGVNSDTDFKYENKGSIPTWKIFENKNHPSYKDVDNPLDISDPLKATQWQTVSLLLRDSDRASFGEHYNIRIIITVKSNDEVQYKSGTIYVGPYQPILNGIFVAADKAYSVTTEELRISNPGTAKFNKEKNYAEFITWKKESSSTDTLIRVYKYFDETDISSYKNINLYFSLSALDGESTSPGTEKPFTLILDRDAPDAFRTGKLALKVEIPDDDLKNFIDAGISTAMHRLTVNRITREVFIDGTKLTLASVYVNPNVVPTRLLLNVNTIQKLSDGTTYNFKTGCIGLDEFYLSDTSPKLIIQDQAKIALNHKGPLLSTEGFTFISDPSFNATCDITGTVHTDNDFTDRFSFSGNADAEVTLATIKIANEIGRASDSENIITSAGHTISTTVPVLKFLTFEENFIQNKDDRTADKINAASLNFGAFNIPLTIKGSTKISSDSWALTQELQDSLNFNIGNKFRYALDVHTKLNQKTYDGKKINTGDYFDSWLEATKYQFSFGDPDAVKRTINGAINNTFTFPFANFAPELNFSQSGIYTSGSQTFYTDTTEFEALFPFRIKNQNFSFSYVKSASTNQNVAKGGSYESDINTITSAMAKRDWYFTAFPIYDLFSSRLSEKVLNTMPSQKQSSLPIDQVAQGVSYNGSYNFNWRRPIFATKYDFFIPTIASLSVARDISTTESMADTYQIKATAGYTAFNIFSKNGSFPLLKNCYSDEYNFSLQMALKIPRTEPENIRQQYNAYLQANFYTNQEDVIRTALQFSLQDIYNWNTKGTVLYKRKSHFTPILEAVKLFNRTFDYSQLPISRTDSLTITLANSKADSIESKLRQYQSIDFDHQIEFQILKQLSISGNIGFEFSHIQNEICTLNVNIGIGGKLNF